MPPLVSEPALLVLLGLRLKGFADTDVVARVTGLPVDGVGRQLSGFSDEGLVMRREGRLTGWSLTASGRSQGERLLADELDRADGRAPVREAYERFVMLNPELLSVCTAWQMRGDNLNDHSDAAYDQGVITQLIGLHDRVRPVVVDLREMLTRFGGYATRLRSALERVAAGDNEWFTKPVIDSYHSVWFELHEDLLATLGLERAKETA